MGSRITMNDIIRLAQAIVDSSSEEHEQIYQALVAKAKNANGNPASEILEISYQTASYLIIHNNGYNRAFDSARAQEYARQMADGEWHIQGQGVQFYGDAEIGDGQHRLSGQVLSKTNVKYCVFFGLEREAVSTIDCGKGRKTADFVQLLGIADARHKSTCVTQATEYLRKVGVTLAFKSNREIGNLVVEDDALLLDARNIAEPIALTYSMVLSIKAPLLTAMVYALLKVRWSAEQISEELLKLAKGGQANNQKDLYLNALTAISLSQSTPNTWRIMFKFFSKVRDGEMQASPQVFNSFKEWVNPSFN